jgi:hypothetical protein
MPWADDDESPDITPGVYEALLAAEEEKFARHGGRRILVGDEMVISPDPDPVLKALRAGEPAVVYVFQIPRDYRPDGRAYGSLVVVYPYGKIAGGDAKPPLVRSTGRPLR